MSTRPPLPPEHVYAYHFCNTLSSTKYQAKSSSHQKIINSSPFLNELLSKLYIASHTLQLHTETRFAYLILFHRCLSHYIRNNFYADLIISGARTFADEHACKVQISENVHNVSQKQREEIGNFAAASIFLACKLCNQQRRIRDVINVKHMLQFDADANNFDDCEKSPSCTNSSSRNNGRCKSKFQPPLLDQEYWNSKEEMVQVEQTLLRIIAFDVNIAYPHRILVILWEELVSIHYHDEHGISHGNGTDTSNVESLEGTEQSRMKEWKYILNSAWTRLNDSLFCVDALMCKASALACASLSLALDESENENHKKISTQSQTWRGWIGVEDDEFRHAKAMLIEAANVPKMLHKHTYR